MSRGKGGVFLQDGPCAGAYSVTRAPYFLRAVRDRSGRCDLLDQLVDEPLPAEQVHVYEATGPLFSPDDMARLGTFICPRPQAAGTYRWRSDVDGERVRSTEDWRTWARAQDVDRPLLNGVTLESVG